MCVFMGLVGGRGLVCCVKRTGPNGRSRWEQIRHLAIAGSEGSETELCWKPILVLALDLATRTDSNLQIRSRD